MIVISRIEYFNGVNFDIFLAITRCDLKVLIRKLIRLVLLISRLCSISFLDRGENNFLTQITRPVIIIFNHISQLSIIFEIGFVHTKLTCHHLLLLLLICYIIWYLLWWLKLILLLLLLLLLDKLLVLFRVSQ